jgi:CHAT domain-containing protein
MVVVPSASMFEGRRSLPDEPQVFVLVSDNDPEHPLPDAEQEGRDIAALYGAHATLYNATSAAQAGFIRAMRLSDIVHFIGHTRSSEGSIEHDALALFRGGDILTGPAIWRLDLRRHPLVVLNACGTDRGVVLRSEGPASLAVAFVASGAGAVVATLWDVDDAMAARILTAFHERFRDGRSASQALSDSLTAARRENVPLKDWSAFRLVGDLRKGV